MEDPWSTPWAVDTPSASPGLAPTTKPKAAAAPLPGTGTITPITEVGGLGVGDAFENSPWGGATTNGFDARHAPPQGEEGDGNAWGGGWDDGKHNAWTGNQSEDADMVTLKDDGKHNAWTSSQNEDADMATLKDDGKHNAWTSSQNEDADMATLKDSSDGFSAPWGPADRERGDRLQGGTYSAVSFDDQPAQETKPAVGDVEDDAKKNATMLLEDEQDAWTAPRGGIVAPSQAIADDANSPNPDQETGNVEDLERIEEAQQPVLRESLAEEFQPGPETRHQKASKVQELVDMYDGIGKKAVPPTPDTIPRISRSTGSAEASEEDLTTQDSLVEESPSVEPERQVNSSEEDSGITTSTKAEAPGPKGRDVAEELPAVSDDATKEETSSTVVEAVQDSKSNKDAATRSANNEQLSSTTTSKIRHPPYPIDLSNLETLFPGSQPPTTNPEPVPDVIIDNSFTTTSERRTWYRISRFGSTRKHDSGDEDNYKRITWATSDVRTRTLHIVRRWMEQDSITGRVVLGSRKAGPLGASMFNWDSSEPQIEISELLRQRVQKGGEGGGHTRNRSLPQADVAPLQTPTMEEFGGWAANASVPSTPSAVVQSPKFAAQIKERAGSALRPPPESPAEMPRSPWDDDERDTQLERRRSKDIMPPPLVLAAADTMAAESSSEPTTREPEPANADEEEDDDDWGEMVSSPTVISSATFAPLSASAELKPTAAKQFLEADFSGLDCFEPSAPKRVRAKPPPPISTSGLKAISASPIWTPTMNSPALEPIRVSMDNVQTQSTMATPTNTSTPVLEPPRTSTSSKRMSMEKVCAPVVSTPTTNNRLSTESAWTPVAASPRSSATPAAKETKRSMSKRVSFEDTCTEDEKDVMEEALRSLPDLTYMLR